MTQRLSAFISGCFDARKSAKSAAALLLCTLIACALIGLTAFQADSKGQLGGLVSGSGVIPPGNPQIVLDVSGTAPRPVEDSTVRAITRDYGRAWHDMADALEQGRSDELAASFVGIAQQKLVDRISAQQKAGLSTRIIDHGHRLQAIFYSPEGSAMQLRDTAQYELQVLDGGSVVATQNLTVHYLAVMTVAEDRWKVRVLQEIEQ